MRTVQEMVDLIGSHVPWKIGRLMENDRLGQAGKAEVRLLTTTGETSTVTIESTPDLQEVMRGTHQNEEDITGDLIRQTSSPVGIATAMHESNSMIQIQA